MRCMRFARIGGEKHIAADSRRTAVHGKRRGIPLASPIEAELAVARDGERAVIYGDLRVYASCLRVASAIMCTDGIDGHGTAVLHIRDGMLLG